MTGKFYAGLAAVVLTFGSATGAAADPKDWTPPGPIQLFIGFQAGGGADTQARLIASELEDRFGWKIVPQQEVGNNGSNALLVVADAPKDGTAITMVVSEAMAYNAIVTKNPDLDLDNFTALATTARFQFGMVAKPGGPYDTWNKVIEAAKSGKSISVGASSPFIADVTYNLARQLGYDFNIVTGQGGAGVMNGVIAGDLDVGWVAGAQSKAVKSGDLVNILSGISERLPDSPDAPTLSEIGSDFLLEGYFMFAGPADMDETARMALSEAIQQIVEDPETQAGAMIKNTLGGPAVLTGDKLDSFLQESRHGAEELLKAVSN